MKVFLTRYKFVGDEKLDRAVGDKVNIDHAEYVITTVGAASCLCCLPGGSGVRQFEVEPTGKVSGLLSCHLSDRPVLGSVIGGVKL